MDKQFDVIICGCGPAGATAGVVLARQGYSVAMLDRARFPRKKLCGGLLTWKSIKLLESVLGESAESLTRAGVINHASDHYLIRTYTRTLAEGDLSFPFHFVDRTEFDNHLLSHAKSAGATVFEGNRVVDCNPEQGKVTLESGEVFKGQYVIGADGANSVVRSSYSGYDRDRFKRYMAPAIEVSLRPSDFPRPVTSPELIVGFIDAGYGWVFPNQDRVIVGICGLRNKKVNFSDLFKSYLEFLKVDPAVLPQLHGHPLPYGNYLENPVLDRLLLAGDAGGFVEPLFGEGIFYALCSGLYAGESIVEGLTKKQAPGPIYTQRMHQQIIPELRASNRLRWALFTAMKYTGPASLGLFVNSASNRLAEMVQGIRSYSWLRKKHWDFL